MQARTIAILKAARLPATQTTYKKTGMPAVRFCHLPNAQVDRRYAVDDGCGSLMFETVEAAVGRTDLLISRGYVLIN
jgi:hypothetical protein